VNKPPSTTIYSFAYDLNTTVKVALISLLKDSANAGSNEKFGLYYPMKGIWLDEAKTLEFYDIEPQVISLKIIVFLPFLFFYFFYFFFNFFFFFFFFFESILLI